MGETLWELATRLTRGLDKAVGRTVEASRWLVLPVALVLFLQWPLRDFVKAYSRDANDLGQWVFALYISLAMTFATRERSHLAVDAVARRWSEATRNALARWGGLVCVAPWAMFMIWSFWPTAQRSVLGLEKFPDTFNPGYFVVKSAALLLAMLALLQAMLDATHPGRPESD